MGEAHRQRTCIGTDIPSSQYSLQKQEDVRYSRQGCLRYFLSNTNSGWLTTARSNSSSEESAVTP